MVFEEQGCFPLCKRDIAYEDTPLLGEGVYWLMKLQWEFSLCQRGKVHEEISLALGIAETGCSVMFEGDKMYFKLKISKTYLLKTNVTLCTADGKKLTVIGPIPVVVSAPGSKKMSQQILHIAKNLVLNWGFEWITIQMTYNVGGQEWVHRMASHSSPAYRAK